MQGAIDKIGGIMQEDLPTSEKSIQQVEKEQFARLTAKAFTIKFMRSWEDSFVSARCFVKELDSPVGRGSLSFGSCKFGQYIPSSPRMYSICL